jgi:MoxR-like ATPase
MAVNVALSLGRPLLLTGDPGSGKTSAAAWIAQTIALPETCVHEFQVRSDSRARDMRYDFDAVTWFRASQLAPDQPAGGLSKDNYIHPRALGLAFGWNGPVTQPHLVLIDEIDKAPRDFPNDLLLELDQMRFTIDETQRKIGPPKHRPVIVITSNAERRLPDPFLRRCIVHNISLSSDTIFEIIKSHLASFDATEPKFLRAATDFWGVLANSSLSRKPTIAEYWLWLGLVVRYSDRSMQIVTDELADPSARATLPFIQTLLGPTDLPKIAEVRK